MAWCGCSRKGRQCLASSGGGAAGWSVSTSTPYIPWKRGSNKALQPFSGGVYGWVFCAKNWQRRGLQGVQDAVEGRGRTAYLRLKMQPSEKFAHCVRPHAALEPKGVERGDHQACQP